MQPDSVHVACLLAWCDIALRPLQQNVHADGSGICTKLDHMSARGFLRLMMRQITTRPLLVALAARKLQLQVCPLLETVRWPGTPSFFANLTGPHCSESEAAALHCVIRRSDNLLSFCTTAGEDVSCRASLNCTSISCYHVGEM